MTALRDRILAAAVDRTTGHGWASLTMARLADDVGVSRQKVYNEIGGKDALAQAIVRDELGRFLALVEAQFERHPRDPVAGIARATSAVLSRAAAHPLLRAMVSLDGGHRPTCCRSSRPMPARWWRRRSRSPPAGCWRARSQRSRGHTLPR